MGTETKEKDVPRILIVDDVETNRFTLRDIIRDMGYQPILTENGEQALRIVERFPLSLIISDVAMPVMDGYELCTRIKENPETRDIPIIFISAFDDPADIVKGFEVKGEDYVTKPFIPEVVKARVQMHLKLSESNRQMQEMNRKLAASVSEQVKQMEQEKQNVLYALLRVVREHPSFHQEQMERLCANCKTLTEALQLSNQYGSVISDTYVRTIELAAPMNSLGNVAVPTELFARLDELTAEEQKEFARHTTVGAEILRDIRKNSNYNDFLDMAIEISNYHHECWDGSGYPEGLQGDEIPLAAQIVAVVSEYNKLTASGGLDPDAAFAKMEADSGVCYNPEIFEIFRKIGRQLR